MPVDVPSTVWDEPSRRPTRADLVVAGVFAVTTVPVQATIGAGAAIAAALLAGALAVRRRSWVAMAGLGLAAGLIQAVTGQVAFFASLAYALVFSWLGAQPDRRARWFGLVAAVLGSLVGGVVVVMSDESVLQPDGTRLAFAIAASTALAAVVCVGGWGAGYLRWQGRQAVQARIDAQLEAAERRRIAELYDHEQERRRIAADMHDVVAHSWAVVAAQADGGRYALRQDPARAEAALTVIADTARTAIADLRTIVGQLRDPGQDAPEAGPERQAELVERMRASGMTLDVIEHGMATTSPLLALTAHRLLAEALTNALKHGDLARPVVVEQDWRDGYRLRVVNGVGERSALGTGQGVAGMVERAAVAGGRATSRADGEDWVVDVEIPEMAS